MKTEELALLGLAVLLLAGWKTHEPHSPNVSTGQQHPATRTPMTATAFRDVLWRMFQESEGRPPTPKEEAMLLAHSAAETGRWKSMYGRNPGFVTSDGGVDWFAGSEIDASNPLKFRWYATAEEGVRDWLYQLKRNWPRAWESLDGNVFGYVDGLYKGEHGSYFGGQEVYARYQRLINALFNEFALWTSSGPDKRLRPAPAGREAPPRALPVAWRGKRRKLRASA